MTKDAAIRESGALLGSAGARPLRYLLVGATSVAAHCSIMIGADRLGLHYMVSTIISFLLVTPMAFWLHSRFTFGAPLTWYNLRLFALGVAAGFPLSLLAMAILCSALRLPVMVAAPISTVLLFAWNYLSARFAITGPSSRRLPG